VLARAFRAIILDGRMYRQLSDEPQEMFYAIGLVLISAAAFGYGFQATYPDIASNAPEGLVFIVAATSRVTSWVAYSGIIFFIGTRFLGGKAEFRTVLRNMGFVFAPGVIAILSDIHPIGLVMFSLSFLWLYPAGLVAIKETQQFGWIKAVIVNSIGWVFSIYLLPPVLIANGISI